MWLWLALTVYFVLYFMLALWWRSAAPHEGININGTGAKENRLGYDMLVYVTFFFGLNLIYLIASIKPDIL
jgi:hypothetical protein